MIKGFLKRFLQGAALVTATASMLLVPVGAEAAKPTPTPLSCSISPANGSTAAGVPVTFTASTSGGKGAKSYSWNFSAGAGSPATAITSMVSVTYSMAGGPFDVLLAVTDGQGANASCGTTVTVTPGGGGNTVPEATNDAYSTDMDTVLTVSAPGVLANDQDADSDPLSAVLDSGATSGIVNLNPDGSFSYTPDSGFTGRDEFTYFAHDGTAPSLNPATVTITVNDTTQPPAGEALFRTKCIMCHGEYGAGGYAHRSIKGARADRIRNAMSKWPEMAFLMYLTDANLADIETYLASVPRGDRLPRNGDLVNGEAQFRQSCTYCHSFGGAPIDPPRPGPDLMDISTTYSDTWLGAWIDFPNEMIAAGAYDPARLANFRYVMPDLGHAPADVWDVVDYLVTQGSTPVIDSPPVPMQEGDPNFDASKQVYFNHCAGCHGLYRTGATGRDIQGPHWDEDVGAVVQGRSNAIGTDGLGAILRYGTPAGMGNFGQSGILTEEQIANLAAYLQLPAPAAPPLPMADIQASWNLIVPVADRPIAPQHTRNWENFTGVVLRDAGQVAIFDGDTNEEIARLSTGFAVHILRSSSTGRYFYAIGRDGLVSLIDLWTPVPTIVATVKGCHDARSVDGSKYPGYEDKFVIEGCYWPPQYVVYDGLTLEPKQRVDLQMTDINGDTLIENRVASIVASHDDPVWVISQKEAGYVSIVDYSDPAGADFPITANIAAAKYLHDGGFDHTGNYFLVAANASNKMVVVDLVNQNLEAIIDVGAVPHPGRGVNWLDPDYGWVNATSHVSEGKVLVYGADPVDRPDVAWQVVRDIPLPSAGSLFIKSHPASPWVLVDMTKSTTGHAKDVCAIAKSTGTLDHGLLPVSVDPNRDGCFTVATNGPAVHFEFNQEGTEVWVSDWDPNGAVIVLDSETLTEIRRFVNLQTPTGKFNVYNTAHDIY
jgi:nitrite reductase (NO-forming)/hydroxylamine reductase